MTLEPPLWMQNTDYDASEDRKIMMAFARPGVIGTNELKVTQRGAGANMSVDVAAGYVLIDYATASRGKALCYNTAAYNVAISAAPGGGNSRYDLIVAELTDTQYGDGADAWTLSVVAGTPSATPSVPATPAGAVALAEVFVGTSVSSITTANCADVRPYARSVTAADRRPAVATNGQVIIDSNGVVWTYAGSAWSHQPHASQFGTDSAIVGTDAVPGPAAYSALTSSLATYATATVAQPDVGDVNVTASWVGESVCQSGTNAVAYVKVDISLDGGSTWTDGAGIQSLSPTTLQPMPTIANAVLSGTPTGSIQARVRAKETAGQSSILGQLTLTVTPA